MGSSIQEYLKKINSELSIYSCLSVLVTTICLGVLMVLSNNTKTFAADVSYIQVPDIQALPQITTPNIHDSRPFASKNGKTYTFSWCQGASRIHSKNKIYFESENSAVATGRTLSKLCKK